MNFENQININENYYSLKHLFSKTQINNLIIFELEGYTCETLDNAKSSL